MQSRNAGHRQERPILAVFDLDGTLTSGDTLLPFLFFVAGPARFFARLPRVAWIVCLFASGLLARSDAKARLISIFLGGLPRREAEQLGARFAAGRLPELVRVAGLERVTLHRRQGHRCVLVSASPELYVEPWARAAGFHDVLATRLGHDAGGRLTGRIEGENCRGEEKVRRLRDHYDLRAWRLCGYGDSRADRPFLGLCEEAHFRPFRDTGARANRVRDLLRLMRPHQWLKNAFVFVGILFGHAWSNSAMVGAACLAAAAFCLVASAIYIVNDFSDRARDRLHPTKRNRPLASGRVTPAVALGLAALLLSAGAGLALAAGFWVVAIVAAYAMLNLAYTFGLKDVVIVDVFIIAAGFILRILAGTLGIGIDPSQWLLLCSLLLTLFLGFTKRRSELLALSSDSLAHRKSLGQYSPALLDKLIDICACGSIMSYALYTMSPDVQRLHGTTSLIYAVPFVAYGVFRYLYLLHGKGQGTDTSRELLRDRHMVAAVAGWGAVTLLALAV